MIKGIAVGSVAAVVLGAGAVTGYKAFAAPEQAEVLAVKDVFQTVTTPQEQCDNVTVQRRAPVQDEKRVAGSVVGAVAGGLIGSTIGGGSGKTLATVAGAAAGGYAGNRVQKNLQDGDTVASTERRCRTVNVKSQQLVGYDVSYRLAGKQGLVRTSFKPGATLPVKDGVVVTTPPQAAKA
jgi:uncharacterized protein YcfJ